MKSPLPELLSRIKIDLRRLFVTAIDHTTPQVTPQVKALLEVTKGEHSREELQALLELSDRHNFKKLYLAPALEADLIERTIPDKPNSRLQKYRLTEKGRALFP